MLCATFDYCAVLLSIAFCFCYAECHYAQCRYADCRCVFKKVLRIKKGLIFLSLSTTGTSPCGIENTSNHGDSSLILSEDTFYVNVRKPFSSLSLTTFQNKLQCLTLPPLTGHLGESLPYRRTLQPHSMGSLLILTGKNAREKHSSLFSSIHVCSRTRSYKTETSGHITIVINDAFTTKMF